MAKYKCICKFPLLYNATAYYVIPLGASRNVVDAYSLCGMEGES